MNDREKIDWNALDRLRTAFLEGTAGQRDYWLTETDLAGYDATFAQRIGWKWDYVLQELQRRRWSPPTGAMLDWGCGSGVASRAFLDHFGVETVASLFLWDRSPLAMKFAARRAREKYPGLETATGLPSHIPATVLLSHVLTELNPSEIEALTGSVAAHATSILWVEPGTFQASRALIAVRESLRNRFYVVAPCTHQSSCGLLTPENERHWCHHFAPSPPEVFTQGHWARFAALAGVDLRSLPLSFFVLDQRPVPPLPPGASRFIGHPRVYKGYASVLACDAERVRQRQIEKRAWPDIYRQAKKDQLDPLQILEGKTEEITAARPLDSP